jgi:hypothetical protein
MFLLENPYSEAAVATDNNGDMQLWFGPERLAGMFQEYRQKGSDVPTFHTILQHELFHAAGIDAQRQRWEAAGKAESFNTFRRREAAAITSDIHNATTEAIDAGNYKLANALSKGVRGGLFLYTEGRGPAGLETLHRMTELVRQLVELKRTGQISEDIHRPFYMKLIDSLRRYWVTAKARLQQLAGFVNQGRSGSGLFAIGHVVLALLAALSRAECGYGLPLP